MPSSKATDSSPTRGEQGKTRLSQEFKWLAFGSITTIIATVVIYQLWNLNPRVPVLYSGDGLLTLNGLRNMKLGGWYWTTDKLGAPFGQDLRDFPAVADNFHLVILWIGIKIIRDEFLVFNGFFFATYLFAFIGGYVGSRMLRISSLISCFVGILFAFLPFHFLHGPGHLYLAAYWPIPIWFAFLARQLQPQQIRETPSNLKPKSVLRWLKSRAGIQATLIAFIAATTGLYYAFFFLVLTLVTALVLMARKEERRNVLSPCWAALVTVLFLALQFFPIWLFQQQNGDNLSIVKRSIAALEFYSLKLSNMILPVANHRISVMADIRERANPEYLIGERTDALGFLAAIGLIAIILMSIYGLRRQLSDRNQGLIILAVTSLFIAMTGGFSYLLGIAGFTQIRVWSRMSIVIAFPALVVAGLLLERAIRDRKRVTQYIAVLAIAILSILDTNPGQQLPSFEETAIRWNHDKILVRHIEQTAGPNAKVLQLPVVPFPENPPVNNMQDYEHLRGYMHSDSLGWSYGVVKGRNNLWMPLPSWSREELLNQLGTQNFDVIWINRNGLTSEDWLPKQLSTIGYLRSYSTSDIDVYILNLGTIRKEQR